jgi:hypothetical protein
MAWQDDIAVKRQEQATKKASQSLHDESIDAILGSGENMAASTDKLAKSDDIDNVIKQLKEVQLSTMLGASKPSVILTDQTDLGDKIAELATKFEMAIKGLDSSDNDAEEVKQLQALNKALQDFIAVQKADNASDTKADKALLAAVKALDMKPVVNVPTPKVTVQSAPVDLSPLQNTLREYFASEESEDDTIDLDCYRAQDIDNTNPNMQYIGFVNPEGNWYIIENDVAGNRMRYMFGTNGYEEAFANAPMYTYSLLNEAVHALSA